VEEVWREGQQDCNVLREMGVNPGTGPSVWPKLHPLAGGLFWRFGNRRLVAPLNFRFTNEDIVYCAHVSQPAVCLCDEVFAERMMTIRSDLPTLKQCVSMGTRPLRASNPSNVSLRETPQNPSMWRCRMRTPAGSISPRVRPASQAHPPDPEESVLQRRDRGDQSPLEAFGSLFDDSSSVSLGDRTPAGPHGCRSASVLLTEAVSPQTIFETLSKEELSVVFLLVPWTMDILGALDRGNSG